MQVIEFLRDFFWIAYQPLLLIAVILAIVTWLFRIYNERKKQFLLKDEFAARFLEQYNSDEIRSAVSGYIKPHCSPGDPSNREGEEFLADLREGIFNYIDRSVSVSERSYNLILADTGMGKTAFCINYFYHFKKKFKKRNAYLISLSSKRANVLIKSIKNRSDSLIILDALDEDALAIKDGKKRLYDLLELCDGFRSVIITCRSQFFLGDEFIPRETPIPNIMPRNGGQSQMFPLVRSYISPFDKAEIAKYVQKHFPIWKLWHFKYRRLAQNLAREIPDLAYRPMLLDRLPEIVISERGPYELYDLYNLLIKGWLRRESRWIEPDLLLGASYELAYEIFVRLKLNPDRIAASEVQKIATSKFGQVPDLQHLTSRSLLNRDSKGMFKFAHRSILEFLLVRMAIERDFRSLEAPWSEFMKSLFVSWGHSHSDEESVSVAKEILSAPLARANIAPLFDMWAAGAITGFPKFQTSTERKISPLGTRLAPASWRGTAVKIKNISGKYCNIDDDEFNLKWRLICNELFLEEGVLETISEVEKLQINNDHYHFPSYDQFISLVEALERNGSRLLKDGDLFCIRDGKAPKERLLVTLGTVSATTPYLKIIDKERKIKGTNRTISTFKTGISVNVNYGKKVKVRQLYLRVVFKYEH